MKKINNNKAITLIALVITIIVLLILSAVAIASLKHFGILDKAKFAKSRYSDAQNEEEQKLNEFEKQMGGDETTIDAAEVAFTPEDKSNADWAKVTNVKEALDYLYTH